MKVTVLGALTVWAATAAAQHNVNCAYPIDTANNTCGPDMDIRCPDGQCCSQYGFCGSTEEFCGNGCQAGFGSCDGDPAFSCASSTGDTLASSTSTIAPATSAVGTAAVVTSTTAKSSTGLLSGAVLSGASSLLSSLINPRLSTVSTQTGSKKATATSSSIAAPTHTSVNSSLPNLGGHAFLSQYFDATGSLSSFDWKTSAMSYFFAAPTTANGISFPSGSPDSFVKTAHANKNWAILSVGGYTGSEYFSDLVSTASSQASFAQTIGAALTKYGFDGVDIKWEYPNSGGIGCNHHRSTDSAQLLSFLQELRKVIGSSKLLTLAVEATGIIGANRQPITDMKPYVPLVDYVTAMAYDTYGPGWSKTSGPNAPLYSTCSTLKQSVYDSFAYFTSVGFPANKLLLGVPSYAYTFKLTSNQLTTTSVSGKTSKLYNSIVHTIPQGDCNDQYIARPNGCANPKKAYLGTWTYNSMISCGVLSADGKTGLKGYRKYYDTCSSTPFLWNAKKETLITYEDAQSIAAKAAFVKANGLAGLSVFTGNGLTQQILQMANSDI